MENTIKLLTEDILCKEELINEAKKIGIDKLPFGYQSLNSFIDGKTMDVHYNGHYKTYVKKLNNALSKENYGDVELEEIIKSISKYDDTIRNNAGGAFNHALFWKMLSPKKQEIPQNLKTKINKEFGSYLEFKKEFEDTAKKIFGSGWAWLVLTKQGKLKVMSTPNQDNPLMNVIKGGGFPLLGLDTWEHAYYLKYKNKRDEYIKNFWDVINWEFVNDLYLKRQKSKLTESVRIIKESNDNYIQPNGSINPKIVQEFLTNIYPECSPKIITDYDPTKRVTNACWGKIESNDCKTTYGVIGGKYAISTRGGVGEWSVINWFDGNQKVGKKIKEIFLSDNPDNDEFNAWMDKNNTKLFTEDGEYIDTLINEISNVETKQGTLDRGIELENITEKILNKKNVAVTRFCDGDVRDKFEGKDFSIIDNGVEKFIQVKRLDHLQFIKTPNNYTNYIFISKNLYRRENIHIFAFVQNEKNYLFFENKGIYKKTNDGFYKYTFFSREKIFTNDTNESSIFKKNILKEEAPKKKPSKKPRQTKFNVADKTIRELIHSVYPKCSEVDSNINGCVGTIERDRCVTGKGVIGGKFMESNYGGDSEWSLVNRWDANSNIHRKILQLYNDDSLSDEFGLEAWITMNKLELFSNDGKYTPILAELGSVMVTKGVKNETYAKDIIKRIYRLEPDQEGISWQLYNNCSGSINDTKYGQDIVLEINNTTYYFQVKQTTENDIKIVTDDRGNFYRVNSYFPHQKYKMEKVDIIVYVDPTNDKYIFFKNDYDYIQTVGSGEYTYKYHINYYEEPIITNMNLEKISLTPSGKEEKELLKKTKEEKIKYYKERLDYFRQKLKDLGFSDDLRESVKNYTIKLMKLLKE